MKFRQCIMLAIGLAFASSAGAQVAVDEAWVRATAPGQPVAGAYLKIKSSQAAALVAVHTPVTARAEIHEIKMEGGVMKMRAVARIELPAGKTVELKPGGYHLMLMNITTPLRPRETVPITLVIEGPDKKRTEVEISAEVRDLTGGMSGHRKMH
ncbi:MAG: copper chaperone PCu(A)C [Betaproteobacteria bacterium]|nr:copper chaperone PCu(A)C [Betaproteobacteria bacterium]MDH3437425.1 copper chaperone PCu(A)C [Betaproteobacteria bacterium]